MAAVPNFVNPPDYPDENAGPAILGATLTVTILAVVSLVARLYVRTKLIRNVGWDDYTMIIAAILSVVFQAVIIPEVYYGAGRHINKISPQDFERAYKLNFVTQPITIIAQCVVKLSIGFFLLRVAVVRFYRISIISVMAFMGFYTIAAFLTVVLQCTNLAVQWDPRAKGTCWDATTLKALSYTNVGLNILTDLLFAIIIPIPMLWHVQMNRRQKTSIIGILGLGTFATAAALVKLSYLPNYGKTGDWMWDSRNLTIWNNVELNVGIIAGNLPCLKPLFRKVLGSTYGRGSRARRTTSNYLSRPYGAGTGHGPVRSNYNSLHSSKNNDEAFHPYGTDEAVMMTNITAQKDRPGSANSSREDIERKADAETISWLNDQSPPKMGSIMKTTEVAVSKSRSASSSVEDDAGHHESAQRQLDMV